MASSPFYGPAVFSLSPPPCSSSLEQQALQPSPSTTDFPPHTKMAKKVAPLPPQTKGRLSPEDAKLTPLRRAHVQGQDVVRNPNQDFPKFLQGLASLYSGTVGPFLLTPQDTKMLMEWYDINIRLLRQAGACRQDKKGRIMISQPVWERLNPRMQQLVLYLGELLRHEALIAKQQTHAASVASPQPHPVVGTSAPPATPRVGQQQTPAHPQHAPKAVARAPGPVASSHQAGPSSPSSSSPVVDSKVGLKIEIPTAATPYQLRSPNPHFNTPPTDAASFPWTHATVLLYSLTIPTKTQAYSPKLPAQGNKGVCSSPGSPLQPTRRYFPYTHRATPFMFMGHPWSEPSL